MGDDRAGWRPQRFGYELWGTKAGIEFATAKLFDYAADGAALEANPNPFAVVVLAHLKAQEHGHDDEARRATEVRLVKGLYERAFSAERIRQLYRLIDGMMSLPKPLGDLAWKEIREFAKEKNMPFITGAERVGREEGRAEGRAEALQTPKGSDSSAQGNALGTDGPRSRHPEGVRPVYGQNQSRPFRAAFIAMHLNPGRCPGLMSYAASRLRCFHVSLFCQ